ncbi:MAG: hypothetical protein GYA23_00350 [Methanomicrobiales archaeon]|nr:hypothetical protein [Methanomicrobiales archaeon]
MKPPRIPPMVTDLVQTAICSFDNAEFSSLAACPVCGGPVQGYDTRCKRYAILREGATERPVTVKVKRFICRHCKTLCNADEPYYPGTRTGSLVIDLFFTLSSTMPASKAARVIDTMNIVVDRTTWRNYCRKDYPEIPATEIFGMQLPLSVLTLSSLTAKSREGDANKGADLLAACGYPSSYQSAEKSAARIRDKKKKLQSTLPMASSQSA